MNRRPLDPRRQCPGQLEHHRDPGGAVVRALEAGPDVVLGVVVGAEDDRTRPRARDAADDVEVRSLDPDLARARVAQSLRDQLGGLAARRRARGPLADRDLRLEIGEGALGVEAPGTPAAIVVVAAAGDRDAGTQREPRIEVASQVS